jgi:hypothetical protein
MWHKIWDSIVKAISEAACVKTTDVVEMQMKLLCQKCKATDILNEDLKIQLPLQQFIEVEILSLTPYSWTIDQTALKSDFSSKMLEQPRVPESDLHICKIHAN